MSEEERKESVKIELDIWKIRYGMANCVLSKTTQRSLDKKLRLKMSRRKPKPKNNKHSLRKKYRKDAKTPAGRRKIKKYNNSLRGGYRDVRRQAKRVGVPFELSFEEFVLIWMNSRIEGLPAITFKGRGKGKAMLVRIVPELGYRADNLRIEVRE